ncbi:MAG: response regulator [Bdellovibrionia bacterium]
MSVQGKNVLIIDDSEEVRYLERKILENLGLVVTEATTIDLAMDILKDKIPHLIILDLDLPGINGFDFLTIRSQTPEIKVVPVIVASSRSDKESVNKALSLGANNYVLKPINTVTLSQRVIKHIGSLEYMRYTFPYILPEVSLQIKAQVTGIGNTNFILVSPVRLAKNCPINIVPPSINRVNLAGCVLMSSSDTAGRNLSGRYIADINVMGLKETISKQMKKNGAI